MQQTPVARAYFALQAAAGAVWWILVATTPLVRELTLGGLPALPIALADVPLFVVGSLIAACNIAWAAWLATGWAALVALAMAAYATVTT